jgi:hypothetical protein
MRSGRNQLIAKDKFASESGHWYARDGTPAYTVVGANGKTRNTTLKDARQHNLVPSVTSIINVVAKPGLERWKQQQLLLAALTLPKVNSESEDEYIDRIISDSKEQGKAAANAGTDIHASIESFYRGEPRDTHTAHVQAVVNLLLERFGTQPWIAERSFSHDLGFGGKCDLHCQDIVLDVKTKEFSDTKMDIYDEHLMQLAAYRVGLGMPNARCANVFVSRSHPGVVAIVEHSEDDIKKGWEMFTHILKFWQLSKGYK